MGALGVDRGRQGWGGAVRNGSPGPRCDSDFRVSAGEGWGSHASGDKRNQGFLFSFVFCPVVFYFYFYFCFCFYFRFLFRVRSSGPPGSDIVERGTDA